MAAREIQRWADDASGVPESLRELLRDAARDAPSGAQLDKLIAGVDGALRAPTSAGFKPSLIAIGCAGILLISATTWLLRQPPATAPRPSAAAPIQAPEPARVPLPVRVPEQVLAPPAAPAPPAAAMPRTRHERARPTPSPAAASVPADPALEVLLLRDAKHALVPAPERARQLLLEHERTYAQGAFVEEREALQIELSLRQHGQARARARLDAFRKRFPGSAYQRRLDDLAGTSR